MQAARPSLAVLVLLLVDATLALHTASVSKLQQAAQTVVRERESKTQALALVAALGVFSSGIYLGDAGYVAQAATPPAIWSRAQSTEASRASVAAALAAERKVEQLATGRLSGQLPVFGPDGQALQFSADVRKQELLQRQGSAQESAEASRAAVLAAERKVEQLATGRLSGQLPVFGPDGQPYQFAAEIRKQERLRAME